MDNLWILTEERPKKEVLITIIKRLCLDKGFNVKLEKLQIKPIIKDNKFTFVYELLGVKINSVNQIFIKNVGGKSSFVDFLIFLQENEPIQTDKPIYTIEETKTDDSESRNTGVYQRCSKFVYLEFYYPDCKKIMLYNLKIKPKKTTSSTNIFGTRMLLTLDVEIIGKDLDEEVFKKFEDIDELIEFKNNMRKAPRGNIPILISKSKDLITISGRLYKSGSLSHDPNIGALTLIAKTLRELGWDKDIIITKHGLSQKHLTGRNKFIKIANEIDIKLEGLKLPQSELSEDYWHYEEKSEKIATIFLHLVLEEIEGIKGIYENHAGCERGYLYLPGNKLVVLHKYIENTKAKGRIPKLPDLIICDDKNKEIFVWEGKTDRTLLDGIKEIKLFDNVENEYIKKYYKNYTVKRGVIISGGENNTIKNEEVIFLLNSKGEMIISNNTPKIIINALSSFVNF